MQTKEIKDEISTLNKQLEDKKKEILLAEKQWKIKKIEYKKIKNQIDLLQLDLEEKELENFETERKRKMQEKINRDFQRKYTKNDLLDKYYSTEIDESKEFAEKYVKSKGMY